MAIKNVSLRKQCHKTYFYGRDNRHEDTLADWESNMARVMSSIDQTTNLPHHDEASRILLFLFVALQSMRTVKAAEQVDNMVATIRDRVYSDDPRDRQDFDRSYVGKTLRGFENTPENLLSFVPELLESFLDLNAHLVVSRRSVFITSDNPVFKYNQYCESLLDVGTTGAVMRGFQAFLPISPTAHLVLYDASTYRVRPRDKISGSTTAKPSDIDTLNMLQLISSGMNVYFSDWTQASYISRLHRRAKSLLESSAVVASEFGRVDSERESIIHIYEQTPDLSLDLSFLHLRRRSLKVPPRDRHRLVRPAHAGKARRRREPFGHRSETVTFSRFLGRSETKQ